VYPTLGACLVADKKANWQNRALKERHEQIRKLAAKRAKVMLKAIREVLGD